MANKYNNLPSRLAGSYQANLADPEMLSSQREIALIDARVNDLLQRVDSGESGKMWKELHKHVQGFIEAQALKDQEKQVDSLQRIIRTVKKGSGDYLAWSEVTQLINQRQRLVKAEREHLQQMQTYISGEQAMRIVQALVSSVNQRIADPQVKAAISQDIYAIVQQEQLRLQQQQAA
jgi:hypothetical protein